MRVPEGFEGEAPVEKGGTEQQHEAFAMNHPGAGQTAPLMQAEHARRVHLHRFAVQQRGQLSPREDQEPEKPVRLHGLIRPFDGQDRQMVGRGPCRYRCGRSHDDFPPVRCFRTGSP